MTGNDWKSLKTVIFRLLSIHEHWWKYRHMYVISYVFHNGSFKNEVDFRFKRFPMLPVTAVMIGYESPFLQTFFYLDEAFIVGSWSLQQKMTVLIGHQKNIILVHILSNVSFQRFLHVPSPFLQTYFHLHDAFISGRDHFNKITIWCSASDLDPVITTVTGNIRNRLNWISTSFLKFPLWKS